MVQTNAQYRELKYVDLGFTFENRCIGVIRWLIVNSRQNLRHGFR